jgi:hypothetical protein
MIMCLFLYVYIYNIIYGLYMNILILCQRVVIGIQSQP